MKKKYDFDLSREGSDTVLRNGYATRFGGTDDGQDNGVGAWGFPVRRFPDFAGISLPIRFSVASLKDSPLGRIPGGTICRVYSVKTKKIIYCPLVDIGPSGYTGRVADLTNAAVVALGLELSDGVYAVDVRIINGAKWLPDD